MSWQKLLDMGAKTGTKLGRLLSCSMDHTVWLFPTPSLESMWDSRWELTGGTGHSVFASFSAAMFVVGGSGITFALSAIQDLIQVGCVFASFDRILIARTRGITKIRAGSRS